MTQEQEILLILNEYREKHGITGRFELNTTDIIRCMKRYKKLSFFTNDEAGSMPQTYEWDDYNMKEFAMLVAEHWEADTPMKSMQDLLMEYSAKKIKPKTSPL